MDYAYKTSLTPLLPVQSTKPRKMTGCIYDLCVKGLSIFPLFLRFSY